VTDVTDVTRQEGVGVFIAISSIRDEFNQRYDHTLSTKAIHNLMKKLGFEMFKHREGGTGIRGYKVTKNKITEILERNNIIPKNMSQVSQVSQTPLLIEEKVYVTHTKNNVTDVTHKINDTNEEGLFSTEKLLSGTRKAILSKKDKLIQKDDLMKMNPRISLLTIEKWKAKGELYEPRSGWLAVLS